MRFSAAVVSMRRVLHIEALLVRVESWLVAALVLVMLALAGYNVVYRNVLVPVQLRLATSGPPPVPVADRRITSGDSGPASGPGGAEGFGGGLGEPSPPASDDADGFGGGLGEPSPPASDDADGFGGGLGEPADLPTVSDDDVEGRPGAEPGPTAALAVSEGGPPPPGSFAAAMVSLIDAIKLEWIDVVLRQLVLMVGFLGAMLATARRKHISIDVVGRLLRGTAARIVRALVDLLAALVCVVLAVAGADLVALGLAYPKDLVPWAEEWAFQLVFPVGFGLIALHFGIRLVADAVSKARESAA